MTEFFELQIELSFLIKPNKMGQIIFFSILSKENWANRFLMLTITHLLELLSDRSFEKFILGLMHFELFPAESRTQKFKSKIFLYRRILCIATC